MSDTLRSDTLNRGLRLWDAKDRRHYINVPTVSTGTGVVLCPVTAGMPIKSTGAVTARGISNCVCYLVEYVPNREEIPC